MRQLVKGGAAGPVAAGSSSEPLGTSEEDALAEHSESEVFGHRAQRQVDVVDHGRPHPGGQVGPHQSLDDPAFEAQHGGGA